MSASQRNKGKRGELRVVAMLNAGGIPAARNLEQSRDGGDDVKWALPICCEVKTQQTHKAWRAALNQAERTAEPRAKWWMAWTRADRDEDIVHMPAELFVEMAGHLVRAGIWPNRGGTG